MNGELKKMDFSVMSIRTLLLILGDFSHMVDKMEESDKIETVCMHHINRREVEDEIDRMFGYIQAHRDKFTGH